MKINFYLQEAMAEKLMPSPHVGYIQRMQRLADEKKELTFPIFKNTGRLTPKKDYELAYGVELHPDANNVMVYLCGTHIELLNDGMWYLEIGREVYEDECLDELEYKIYEWILENTDVNHFMQNDA